MSQMAPEPAPRRENVFTRKIGPMPMWAWVTIIAAVLIGWAYYRNKKTQSQQQAAADASQIPQFVNQTYTTVQPPSAPTPVPREDEDEDEDEDEETRRRRKKPKPKRKHPHTARYPRYPVGPGAGRRPHPPPVL